RVVGKGRGRLRLDPRGIDIDHRGRHGLDHGRKAQLDLLVRLRHRPLLRPGRRHGRQDQQGRNEGGGSGATRVQIHFPSLQIGRRNAGPAPGQERGKAGSGGIKKPSSSAASIAAKYSFAPGFGQPYMQRAPHEVPAPARGPSPRRKRRRRLLFLQPRKACCPMTDEPKTVYANTSALIAAEAPDYPSFLFSEREFRKAIKVFKKGFDGLLTYAVKCNPSPHIIAQLHAEGLKAFDVASNVEMELVR